MASQILRYAGFGEEATFGTAVPATIHTDIMSATLDTPDDPNLYYPGGLGRARRVVRPGYYAPTGNVVQGLDVDIAAYLLRWTLGGYNFVAGTPGRHDIWGTMQNVILPSFTTRVGKDVFEHVFAGCVINSLQIQADDSFAAITADIVAQKDSGADLASVGDLELSDEVIMAFHEITIAPHAPVLEPARVRSMDLNIANNVDASSGRGIGSRHPYRLPAGERVISGTFGLWFEDLTQKQSFWGDSAGPAAGGAFETSITLEIMASLDRRITINLPSVIISSHNAQPSERNRLDEVITIQAMVGVSGTTETDILCQVRNGIGDLNGAY